MTVYILITIIEKETILVKFTCEVNFIHTNLVQIVTKNCSINFRDIALFEIRCNFLIMDTRVHQVQQTVKTISY